MIDPEAVAHPQPRRARRRHEELARGGPPDADILFLKHCSSIFRQSSHPESGFSMMEQVRLCAVWPTDNLLCSSINHILVLQGWMTVWICCCNALEEEFLHSWALELRSQLWVYGIMRLLLLRLFCRFARNAPGSDKCLKVHVRKTEKQIRTLLCSRGVLIHLKTKRGTLLSTERLHRM